jgi:hypothetical protein
LTDPEFTPVTKEAILELVEASYSKGEVSFRGEIKLKCQDPVEPLDKNGKYRLHPLIWTIIIGLGAGLGILLCFHFQY